jgi:hypothetical protein
MVFVDVIFTAEQLGKWGSEVSGLVSEVKSTRITDIDVLVRREHYSF